MSRTLGIIVSLFVIIGGIFGAFFLMETRHASAGRVTYLECQAWKQERDRKDDENWDTSQRYKNLNMPDEIRIRYRKNTRDMDDLNRLLDAQCSSLKKGR